MAGVGFAVGGDILMPRYRLYRVLFHQCGEQGQEGGVLRFGKRLEVAALYFDADGKTVAFFSAVKRRHARVVGRIVAGNELHRLARACDEEMAGYAQVFDNAVKRMLRLVDAVGKEFFHRARAVFEGRQGDIVQYRQ